MMIQPASTIRKSLLPMPSSKNAVPVNWLMLIFVKVSFIMTSAALNDTAISKYQPILTRIKVLIIWTTVHAFDSLWIFVFSKPFAYSGSNRLLTAIIIPLYIPYAIYFHAAPCHIPTTKKIIAFPTVLPRCFLLHLPKRFICFERENG